MYGQSSSSDPSSLYAEDYARGMTRAFMFADLVKAIDDVAAGHPGPNEAAEVTAFQQVVQYGREWVAFDAGDLFNANSSFGAIQSSITNDIYSVAFGFIGLPWQGQGLIPSVTQLTNQAQGALWGAHADAVDGVGDQLPNYPIAGAESQQAFQQTLDALSFLNTVGQTQAVTGPSGTNSGLDNVMAQIENGIGVAGGAGDLAGAIVNIANLGADLAGTDSIDHASFIESLVNIVWQGADTVATNVQINDNISTAMNSLSASNLQSALQNQSTFEELFSDFVAMTLHTIPNLDGASGNDPDCRQVDKLRDGSTPPGPTGSDPEWTVSHFLSASPGSPDYSYQAPTLGGFRSDPGNHSGEISDPGVLDWSLTRDTGPGAPRIGTNWPVSEVTYGTPGPPGSGYLLNSPSTYYPASGSWYLTFNGANGHQYQTAPLTISVGSNGRVYPTDSQVEQAIINADPTDFVLEPCSGPDASDLDPAVPAGDQKQGPCTDWNWVTHYGTDVLVSGDQPDNNTGAPPDYQVIFDIMVKGDLGGWVPTFTAHTNTCGLNGGICIYTLLFGAPLGGENITSQEIWPMQGNDVCANDPATCSGNATFGWGDQASSNEPEPYPVSPECQAASPVDGMFQIQYVGEEGGNPSCDSTPNADSWVLTPSLRYQSYFGSLWTAWRVPPSVGKENFVNVETAAFSSGTAGIDPNCGAQVSGSANATCLQGQGTHWTSEFAPGDQILLKAPNTASGNGTGGLLSVVRTVANVIDDTHMTLTASAECLSGSDGNDCDFFNTSAYTSFMNPADGTQGDQTGMLTLPCGAECQSAPTNFEFDIWKLTGLNAGTDCSVWSPSSAQPNPPTSGCYYSNDIQFRAQDGKGWWNASLPAPAIPALAADHTFAPQTIKEPWLHAPDITRGPQTALVGSGGTATFTVAAKGTPTPTVQWQVSTNNAKTWSTVKGATSSTYNVAVTSAESGYDYRAVVKNSNGSRTTEWGTLDVVAAPVITRNPASTKTLHGGQTVSFTSAATGDPAPVPTWQLSQNGGATWQVLETGRSSVSFMLPTKPPSAAIKVAGRALSPDIANSNATDLVRVIYQNQYGSATSQVAKIVFTESYPVVNVAASVSPTPAVAGNPASALITVGDYSGVRATKVQAVTTFSTSLGFKSYKQVSGPKAKCAAKAIKGGESETCSWATLAAHAQATFRASLLPKPRTKTGAITVHATIAQHNGSLGLTNLTVPITKPWADLQLTGTAKSSIAPGTKFADVLTVTNAGPDTATKAKVTITLPAIVKLVTISPPSGTKCTTKKVTITCATAQIRAGRTVRITVYLKGTKKGAATLLAIVSSATADYILTNNSISLTTAIK